MASLLIRNLNTIVTCDDGDHVFSNADLYCEDGVIRAIGTQLPQSADTVMDGTHFLCYPGLVNTHHHLYQVFSRNLPQVQNLELFDWLTALYEIWKNLDEEAIRMSTLAGCGELLKHGCTTCFDHNYVFPKDSGNLMGIQFAAAEELGIRFHASRGSMDLSKKDGGLPPDSVVQTVDEIMKDSARCIEAYHDPAFGSMRQVALAPCSPFSVSRELLQQSAIVARQYHVRLHTHVAETRDEENFTLSKYGMRPLEYMASVGWTGPDVWYAHGIHFNTEELRELARTGTGVAHCPISNMKLASGVARIPEMLKLGVPVGLAVDGSASNDGSSLMEELRVCYLLHRLTSSAAAPSGYDVLKLATRGSARLLGRDDIGQLAAGKCADFFLVDSRRLELTGALYDPKSVLGTVGLRGPVDCTVVNGKVIVRDQRLVTVDEERLAEEANAVCDQYLKKA
jgi:cytosine/adenosine deaminase-related metal-dependent hydrolase